MFQSGTIRPLSGDTVLRLESRPPRHSYTEALTPSTSECNLIWKSGHFRVMSSERACTGLGGTLTQYEWGPSEKEKFGHRHTPGETRCEDEGRGRGDVSASQGTPKMASQLPEARGEAWGRFSPKALRWNQLANTLLLRLAFRTGR